MGLIVRVGQVRIIGHHLIGSEHTLVDDGFGRERTDVEEQTLFECTIISKFVAGLLSDQVQLSLESITALVIGGCDEQLFDDGSPALALDRYWPKFRKWGRAPTDEALTGLLDQGLDQLFAFGALFCILGQEYISSGITPGFGQLNTEGFLGNPTQKLIRQCGENPSPVPVLASQPQAPR